MAEIAAERPRLSLGQVFKIFFKAGCAFGGGLGVLGLLQEELVTLRRILPDKELLTLWSIGRLMPSGTMTAKPKSSDQRNSGRPKRTAETTTMPSAAGSKVALM